MFTLVYLFSSCPRACLPIFTSVHLHLHLFINLYPCPRACLPIFTLVFLCLNLFTYLYPVLMHVYLCLPLFTRVYLCLLQFTRTNLYLQLFICACLPMFTPV